MKRIIIAALALVAMAGCTKDDGATSIDSGVAHFATATAVTRVVSSATSSTWEADSDAIGISSDQGDSNVKYTAASSGTETDFKFADTDESKEIMLPRTGTAKYSAYYPYTTAEYYTSNVSSQSDLGAIDLLVASDAEGNEGMSESVKFEFKHALTMLKFSIEKGASLGSDVSLKDITVSLGSVTTVAYYKFDGSRYGDNATTGSIDLNVTLNDDGTATALAIINPIAISGATLKFTLAGVDGKTFECNFTLGNPRAGYIHSYDATLGFDGVTFEGATNLGDGYSDSIEEWGTEDKGDFGTLGELIEGTEGNPFKVGTQDDLEAIGSTSTHSGSAIPWDASAHYVLTDDITISGTFTSKITEDNQFYGVLDGGGRTIKGLTNLPIDGSYAGLFPYIGSGGHVYDLNVECSITASNEPYMGVIAGYNNGTISNCTVSGSITNTYNESYSCGVGGVVGQNHDGAIVEMCVNSATVTGYWKVGGIVGYLDGGYIVNCGNTGKVTNNTNDNSELGQQGVGGIAGTCDSSTYILSCYNQGAVGGTNVYNVGGVAGFTNNVVSGCYNTGALTGGANIGGVAGRVSGEYIYITSCYYLESKGASVGIGAYTRWPANTTFTAVVDAEGQTVSKDDDYMQGDDFLGLLNAAAANSSYPDVTVLGWKSVSGSYPIINAPTE